MKMAKATEEDMKAALLLLGILEDVDAGKFPRRTKLHGFTDPDDFNEEDPDHLRAFHDRVMTCVKMRPSGISRVIWGFQTILDNNILDPDKDVLELHPRLNSLKDATGQLIDLTTVKDNSFLLVRGLSPENTEPALKALHQTLQSMNVKALIFVGSEKLTVEIIPEKIMNERGWYKKESA